MTELNPKFSDIHEAARQQARDDMFANDYRMWKHTEGVGMPGSYSRGQWDLAYNAAAKEIEAQKRQLIGRSS